MYFRYT